MKVWVAAALAVALLAGCGLKLRGSYLLPDDMQKLHVSSFDQYSEINRLVTQLLVSNDVKLVDAGTDIAHIRINKDFLTRRTLSVFDNAQVAEYELIYTVEYSVSRPNEDTQNHSVEIYRDYQDNPDQVLAKSKELDLVVSEMRRDAADRVVRGLAVVGA